MNTPWVWLTSQAVSIVTVIVVCASSAIAQISPDGTLPNNSVVRSEGNTRFIEGGTRVQGNLFHSFNQFSIGENITAEFRNIDGIQNIISRVTGNSISQIDGILKTQQGATANLFLINPNGIVFGTKAALNINGSFLATTATSLNFENGGSFSTVHTNSTPLLLVSSPIGLQFGSTAAPIRNLSQAEPNTILNRPAGLQVQAGRTLALVGGDISLEGGNLTAESGRIELGSVASGSLVKVSQTNNSLILGYEGVQNFRNIQLTQRNDNGSAISSVVNTGSQNSGGSIQVQGNIVELAGDGVQLTSQTRGVENGKDINITAKKLILRDGALVFTSTIGQGSSGNVVVNASESVELIGSVTKPLTLTALFSNTFDEGNAGDITINTRRLRVLNGAQITAESTGILVIPNSLLSSAEGRGGNLTVNASEFVELIGFVEVPSRQGIRRSALSAITLNYGNAGRVTVNTNKLDIREGAAITTNVEDAANISSLGTPGGINIRANSILLDDQASITSNTESGRGGNISLQVRDVLLLRRNSLISTNAGTARTPGDGGNISINAPNGFIVATPQGNNDITANAFSGAGGRITINANSIFGFVQRDRAELIRRLGTEDPVQLNPNKIPTSDITAFSQQNPSLNGIIQINTPDVDPSRGLLELPADPIDASRQIATGCKPGSKLKKGSLVATGRGGIAPSPTDPLMDDTVLANWITLDDEDSASNQSHQINTQKLASVNQQTQITPAQGWVTDGRGNVTLVAQAPTVTPHSPLLNPASCAASHTNS